MKRILMLFLVLVILLAVPLNAYAASRQYVGEEVLLQLLHDIIAAMLGAVGVTAAANTPTAAWNSLLDYCYNALDTSVQNAILAFRNDLMLKYAAGTIVATSVDGIGKMLMNTQLINDFENWCKLTFNPGEMQIKIEPDWIFKSPNGTGNVAMSELSMPANNGNDVGQLFIQGAMPITASSDYTVYLGHALDVVDYINIRFQAIPNEYSPFHVKIWFQWHSSYFAYVESAYLGSTSNYDYNAPYYMYLWQMEDGSLYPVIYRNDKSGRYYWQVVQINVTQAAWDYVKSLEADDGIPYPVDIGVVTEWDDTPIDTIPADGIPTDVDTGTITIPLSLLDQLLDDLTQTKPAEPPEVTVPPDVAPWVLPNVVISKFPFCIPFDILYLFQTLNCAPEVPKWDVHIKVGEIADTTYPLDLSQFSSLAVLSRTVSVITFTVCLAVGTKKLIGG